MAPSPQPEERSSAGLELTPICPLASGGMGTVELALRHEGRFQRFYAVKRLHAAHRDDADVRAMFLEEARVAGSIRHPNVVGVLDVGADACGPYLVMDYVDGVNLATLLETVRARDQDLPVQVAARIAGAVAAGLHAAHELTAPDGAPLHVIHRDVSPQNILVGFDGSVRVTDFGIAKALGRTTHTSTGVLKGKIGYMAPEQLEFEEPDARSDLFALGVVLYEMLSGARLYPQRDGLESARRILREPPPDIGDERDDVPPAMVELLFRLLAKDRELRPSTAKEVASSISEIVAELSLLEGSLEVSTFVTEALREARESRRASVSDALAIALDRGARGERRVVEQGSFVEDEESLTSRRIVDVERLPADVSARKIVQERFLRTPRAIFWSVVAVFVVLATVAWIATHRGEPADSTARTSGSPPPSIASLERASTPAPIAANSRAPAERLADPVEEASTSSGVAAPSDEITPPRPVRAPRIAQPEDPEPSREAPRSGIPTWTWSE